MTASDNASVLQEMVATLDISPTDFKTATERHRAVGEWLTKGQYDNGCRAEVYLQGSFRLGTVIRPFLNGADADYDIDQVCEVIGTQQTPGGLKRSVGERIREHATYASMLEAEGRRCWTLVYAQQDGQPGFHLDILPSKPVAPGSTPISATHWHGDHYSWHPSDPKGYAAWFDAVNKVDELRQLLQMHKIYRSNPGLYTTVDDVPRDLYRTSLQRSIQVMKRHRDVCFSGRDKAPISIIITTIAAHLYDGSDLLATSRHFADYVSDRLEEYWASGGALPEDSILDFRDGKWWVANPAEPEENFADRWAVDPERAENFFAWAMQLRRDLRAFASSGFPDDLGLLQRGVPTERRSRTAAVVEEAALNSSSGSDALLDAIHFGIEGKLPWSEVKRLAAQNVSESQGSESEDVALVNYYQVKIHSGEGLSAADIASIRRIISKHAEDPGFVFCCSLLLGTATPQMLRDVLKNTRYSDVLAWPILRLADPVQFRRGATVLPVAGTFYMRSGPRKA